MLIDLCVSIFFVCAVPVTSSLLFGSWGTFSWEGDWSDKSPLWTEHPEIAQALKWDHGTTDDGIFWMVLNDFTKVRLSRDVIG